MQRVQMAIQVTKSDPEMGIIWGYASVADLMDLQGDIVPQDELVQAVYQFMQDYYTQMAEIRENHQDDPADVVLVESTFHFIACNLRWFVGVKLLSEELKRAARDGEIGGFSIGGYAEVEAHA